MPCQIACFHLQSIMLAVSALESLSATVPIHCKVVKSLQYFVFSKFTDLTILQCINAQGKYRFLPCFPQGQKHHQTSRDPLMNLEFLTWSTYTFSKLPLVRQCFSLCFCRELCNYKENTTTTSQPSLSNTTAQSLLYNLNLYFPCQMGHSK